MVALAPDFLRDVELDELRRELADTVALRGRLVGGVRQSSDESCRAKWQMQIEACDRVLARVRARVRELGGE